MDVIGKDLDEAVAEAKRRAEEVCTITQSSLTQLCQCIKAWKEGHSHRDVEASHSQDGQLQTHHTSDDGPGPSHRRTSCPTREGCKQDG